MQLFESFLPPNLLNISSKFCGNDSEKSYLHNLNLQPSDWYYRNNNVHYTLNSNGYRAPEFKSVNWEDSVVIFGCSHVFGTGVDDDYTLCSQLERLINRPVINMGVAATSISFSLYNSLILAKTCPIPKAVIQIWSSYNRCLRFTNNGIENYGSWNYEPNNFFDQWNVESNSASSAIMCRELSNQVWSNKTSYYEATMFDCTASIFTNCFQMEYLDRARDLLHPGNNTYKMFATHIADQLTL